MTKAISWVITYLQIVRHTDSWYLLHILRAIVLLHKVQMYTHAQYLNHSCINQDFPKSGLILKSIFSVLHEWVEILGLTVYSYSSNIVLACSPCLSQCIGITIILMVRTER